MPNVSVPTPDAKANAVNPIDTDARDHAWLHNFRRLRIRFERRADIHEAFLKLGCSLVCWNIFRRTEQSLAGKRTALPPFPPQRTVRASFPAYSSGFAEAPFADAGLVPHGTRPARTSYRWLPQHWEQGAELPCDSLFQAALQTSLRYWPAPATTSRKSAPFRAGAKFEPLSGPLQPGVRFLRVLLPAPPTALLAGHLPRLRYAEVTARDRAYHVPSLADPSFRRAYPVSTCLFPDGALTTCLHFKGRQPAIYRFG